MPDPIYLDNNATTRPFPEVVEAMAEHFRSSFANPGSRHAAGRRARRALEDARESIASILGASPSEVVFTSGGTESINTALLGLAGTERASSSPLPSTGGGQGGSGASTISSRAAPPLDKGGQGGSSASKDRDAARLIALTRGEHPATTETCRHFQKHGYDLHFLEVDSDGRLRTDQYDTLPWHQIRLITVILAHNETGVIQDVAPLADLCRRHKVPIHLDAVQAIGKIPVDFHQLGATALSLGAHKFHGPRGIGALLVREGTQLPPLLFGGHQESDRRPGTEPVALAVGMARALEIWHTDQARRTRHVTELRDRLQSALTETCPPVVVNADGAPRLPNTLNVAFPGLDGDAILVALDLEGICCSLGSTCASGSTEPAPSLVAMGCPPEIYRASVRFSLSIETTEAEVNEAIRRISAVVSRLRQQAAL